ncbi:thioredoxin family protein [Yeosuana sp.]|uniref:thioredoxin family protein n=1 Tax=Yeosuana sp. TaxID=2529388 RepID=UPI004054BBDE|tara:strand:- start:240 stop:770 length:531 start_codon:yes stop_codon:yes gene_type:complete
MKNNVLILSLLLLVSCKKETVINKTVTSEDAVIFLGLVDETGFTQEPFNTWFDANYADYKVDDNLTEELKSLLKDVEIKTFMGTWCEDSQREIPNFYKLLDAIDYNKKNLTVIAVNREKTTPQQFEKDLNIANVPTFIFYKNGKEINRIVEYPMESLEKDMIRILSGVGYKHAYQD